MTPPTDPHEWKYPHDDRPLRWRLWWRFGFRPILKVIRNIPVAEWRRESWSRAVDIWAMDHIGRQRS